MKGRHPRPCERRQVEIGAVVDEIFVAAQRALAQQRHQAPVSFHRQGIFLHETLEAMHSAGLVRRLEQLGHEPAPGEEPQVADFLGMLQPGCQFIGIAPDTGQREANRLD
ncbi:hypothetical protein D3C80_1678360 [compost metagenome]